MSNSVEGLEFEFPKILSKDKEFWYMVATPNYCQGKIKQ